MTDELKKADEIVRALRDYASDCDDDEACCQCTFAWVCDKFDNNAPKIIADLIDSLTAQLTESQRMEKAAVEDINLLEDCSVCKHHDLDSCDLAGTKCHFEWRGPQEAERVRGVCGTTSLPCSGCAPVCEHERPQEAEKGKADGN